MNEGSLSGTDQVIGRGTKKREQDQKKSLKTLIIRTDGQSYSFMYLDKIHWLNMYLSISIYIYRLIDFFLLYTAQLFQEFPSGKSHF